MSLSINHRPIPRGHQPWYFLFLVLSVVIIMTLNIYFIALYISISLLISSSLSFKFLLLKITRMTISARIYHPSSFLPCTFSTPCFLHLCLLLVILLVPSDILSNYSWCKMWWSWSIIPTFSPISSPSLTPAVSQFYHYVCIAKV